MLAALRPATAADRDFFRSLYATTRADLAAVPWDDVTREGFISQQFAAQEMSYQQQYAGGRVDVITVDGEPAGRLYVSVEDRELRLVDIALLPAFRCLGVGTGLLEDLLTEADGVGSSVVLHVESTNPARRLYERLGFVRIGEQPPYTEMKRPVS